MPGRFAQLGRRSAIAIAAGTTLGPFQVHAQAKLGADTLIPVLRETVGQNRQDEGLTPYGSFRFTDREGKERSVELAAFNYIGDMHVRFVFDAPQRMLNATPEDFAQLGLNPESALTLALGNLKRLYGPPKARAFIGRWMEVVGQEPNFNSSYFLDRPFWTDLARRHPEGLVVAAPKRGVLIYVPAADQEFVGALRHMIGKMHAEAENMRVSSALYLFKNNRWTVFQPPGSGGR